SIDGEFKFTPFMDTDVGILEVDMEAVFLINDGQHRKAAIEAAMEEDSSLGKETISIVFYSDNGLARSQQMFTDL
ncbi:DNA sulfur modification protein DndB, partial [Klebsiella oxytoca]